MTLAPAIMVQGTASSVGKSLLVTALCRLFHQDGLRVLPFKSQNMSLNSFVTPDGAEIGRAQAAQAEAAGVAPTADMNPVLIKPEGQSRSQIVVMGRSIGSMTAAEYHAHKPALRDVIDGCLHRLRQRCDLLLIEGAGSPAEINLRDKEIVNMHVARAASAQVMLVGDIDRGGVFAALLGTLELLDPEDRERVTGLVVNKFRGDRALLQPGLEFIQSRTGVPVLGVLPYLSTLRLASEDSLSLDDRPERTAAGGAALEVAVVRLPLISNFDDFDSLEHEPGIRLQFIQDPRDVEHADLVILPGSKRTVADLDWLRQTGLASALLARARRGDPLLGVCGGYQMLGRSIEDPDGVESPRGSTPGLDLLPVRTVFRSPKVTAQVRARAIRDTFLTTRSTDQPAADAYEIHMGRVEPLASPGRALFETERPGGQGSPALEGSVSDDGNVVGTLLHGILENEPVRRRLIESLCRRRGLAPPSPGAVATREQEYDRLADMVRQQMDLGSLRRLAGLESS